MAYEEMQNDSAGPSSTFKLSFSLFSSELFDNLECYLCMPRIDTNIKYITPKKCR